METNGLGDNLYVDALLHSSLVPLHIFFLGVEFPLLPSTDSPHLPHDLAFPPESKYALFSAQMIGRNWLITPRAPPTKET